MVSGGAGQIEIAAFGGSTIPNSSFLTPNSFKPVRFQKECGKISLVQSVLSKGNTDFFLGGIIYDDFGNEESAKGVRLR